MAKHLVVAIDGPVGAGKSAVARRLAARLGFRYLDTGAMYRAVTLKALEEGADLADAEELTRVARSCRIELCGPVEAPRVRLDGRDVTDAIRSLEVTNHAHHASQTPGVRRRMVELQQEMASLGPLVAEGRDMGTVVFPDSSAKFYLDATVAARARRRHQEHVGRGDGISLDELTEQIVLRDERDSTREASPLRRAEDAVCIDTTPLTVEQVVERIVRVLSQKGPA